MNQFIPEIFSSQDLFQICLYQNLPILEFWKIFSRGYLTQIFVFTKIFKSLSNNFLTGIIFNEFKFLLTNLCGYVLNETIYRMKTQTLYSVNYVAMY